MNATRWVRLPLQLVLVLLVWQLLQWAVVQAVFVPNLDACAQASGACWGVVAEKWQVLLFGRFPAEQVPQAVAAVVLWTSLMWALASGGLLRVVHRLCGAHHAAWAAPALAGLWFGAGLLLLHSVPTKLWGGLLLTLCIAMVGFGLALPLGIALALGRRARATWLRWPSAVVVELFRALPLVSVLFVAAYVLPLVLPAAWVGDKQNLLPRVILTIGVFAAAYLAEVVRGGLQTVPQGQVLAAQALGFNRWQVLRWVVLPQALKACKPALINSFVTLFKECSLVTIISLFELTGALNLALSGDVQWRVYYLEAALFVAAVYWLYCSRLSALAEHSNPQQRPHHVSTH